jgi:membrane protease YdiL (CAAX protease family)
MRRPYAWEGVLAVFFFLLLLFGLNMVVGVIQSALNAPLILSPLLIIGELLILGLVIIWVALRRLPWQETFYLYKTSWWMIGLSVLVAITWWPVAVGLVTLIEQLFSLIGPPPEIPPPQNTLDAMGYFIAIVILAPLCEEPVFRGFIMRSWLRYGFVAGIVGSGVLFGLQHAQLNGVIPLSLVGIMLAIVAFRAGSLWPAITIHAVYNSLSLPFLIFSERMPEISDATFIIAGLVAMPAALFTLWLYHRLAPPFQSPKREPLATEQGIAILVSLLMVLGMFLLIVSIEVWLRLNPDLGGV